jgi:hypothetical protein
MKKALATGMAASMILTSALLSAGPSTAAGTEVANTKLKAVAVTSVFSVVDEGGCMQTDLTIFGNNSEGKGGTFESVGVVTMLQFDKCQGVILIEGFGSTISPALEVSDNLLSGRLRMSLTFNNVRFNKTALVTVDLTSNATDKAVRTQANDKFSLDNIVIKTTNLLSERPAIAMGTITYDSQVLLSENTLSKLGKIASGQDITQTMERRINP